MPPDLRAIGDINCDNDSIKSKLQAQWAKATLLIDRTGGIRRPQRLPLGLFEDCSCAERPGGRVLEAKDETSRSRTAYTGANTAPMNPLIYSQVRILAGPPDGLLQTGAFVSKWSEARVPGDNEGDNTGVPPPRAERLDPYTRWVLGSE
jgi:hypothetical protein